MKNAESDDSDYIVYTTCENCGRQNRQMRSGLKYTEEEFSEAYFVCPNCKYQIMWDKGDISTYDVLKMVDKMEPMNCDGWEPAQLSFWESFFALSVIIVACFLCFLLAHPFILYIISYIATQQGNQNFWWNFLLGAAVIYMLGKLRIIRVI